MFAINNIMCYTNIVVTNLYNIKEDSKMEEKMITLATEIQFSEERLEEIFAVPKTKKLFDEFMQKEESVKTIQELNELLVSACTTENDGGEELKQFKENIIKDIKVYILCGAIQKMINGKSLNQAVWATLKEEIKEATIFDDVKARIISQLVLERSLDGALAVILG